MGVREPSRVGCLALSFSDICITWDRVSARSTDTLANLSPQKHAGLEPAFGP